MLESRNTMVVAVGGGRVFDKWWWFSRGTR